MTFTSASPTPRVISENLQLSDCTFIMDSDPLMLQGQALLCKTACNDHVQGIICELIGASEVLLGSHHTMSCTISHGNPKRKLKYPKFSQSRSSHFGPPSSFSYFLSLILLRGNPVQKLWHPWAESGLYSGLLCLKMLLSILFSSAFPGNPGEKSQERVNGGPTSKVYNPESNSWPESGRVRGVKIYKFNRKAQAYALSFCIVLRD